MGKESVLPRNIRQIGEICGRERVCIEDYVMTFIHKKETKEEQACLSVFLGEQQNTEEAEYLFIRGILEIPQQDESGETDWNILYEQQKKYFPEWTVQGCCVIGAYPAGRMEELTEAVPEAAGLLYHLQEQEETLYRMADGQYRRLPGYFVFYEQNRKMQEYLSALYGEESVEKEGTPDKAVKSFRAKVEEKGLQRSGSFLRLASSFFVITVLVIGAVVVNRIEDIRKVKNTVDIETAGDGETAVREAQRIAASGDEMPADNQADAGDSAAAASDGAVSDVQQEVEANAGDGAALPGSESFWEDTAAELNEIMQSAPGEHYADGEAAQSEESQAVDAAPQSTESQAADAAPQAAGVSGGVTAGTVTTTDGALQGGADGTQEAVSRQVQATYTIREGDTLADICNKYYGSLDRLEELCDVNAITDANLILPGQKLVLP